MNANQLLSIRVNTRLLRENANALPLLDRLVADGVITRVSLSFLAPPPGLRATPLSYSATV